MPIALTPLHAARFLASTILLVGIIATAPTARAQDAGGCLTWDQLRASLTVLGPPEPLPALPAPFGNGCVTGFADERSDRLFILEAGLAPELATGGFLEGHAPLYGLVPVATGAPDGAREVQVSLAVSAGGSANFILNEAWDEPYAYDTGGVQWRTLSIDGLPQAEALAAMESLRGLWAEGPREFDQARQRNDLAALPDGPHHLGTVPGGAGAYHMLFEKAGDRVRGVDYVWASGYVGCFEAMLAPNGGSTGNAATVAEGAEAPGPISGPGELPWTVSRGVAFDYDRPGTLRPLPAGMAAEHLADGSLLELRDACLAALDAR